MKAVKKTPRKEEVIEVNVGLVPVPEFEKAVLNIYTDKERLSLHLEFSDIYWLYLQLNGIVAESIRPSLS